MEWFYFNRYDRIYLFRALKPDIFCPFYETTLFTMHFKHFIFHHFQKMILFFAGRKSFGK